MDKKEFVLKHGLDKGNILLTDLTKRVRKARPKIPENLNYTIFEAGDFAQIWLKTKGCAFSKVGSCTCCDYWEGAEDCNVVDAFKEALKVISSNITGLLIETSGSVLDTNEITDKELAEILDLVNKKEFKKVVLETHLNTITQEKLAIVRRKLENTEICIEAGVESLNEDILKYSLNKPSVLVGNIKEKLDLIHGAGFRFISNVMLGVPFLSISHQIEDAVNSINKLFEIGTDYIMLFPVNIKEYTLVDWLYQNGLYERINGQLIIKVLECVKNEYINKIDVVWYGNRKQENPSYKKDILGPLYCEECQSDLLDIFYNFNILDNSDQRKELLEKAKKINCSCKHDINRKIKKEPKDFFDFMDEIYTKIKTSEMEKR